MATPIQIIRKKTVSNLNEYLKTIKQIEQILLKENSDDIVIYRGQSVNKSLLPKLGREEYNFLDRLSSEMKIISEFERLSYPIIQNHDYNKWDIIAIAQHHSLPTRLLDWTGNPLIALWFAISNIPKDKIDRVVWCYSFKQTEIVDSNTGDPFSQSKTLVFQPKRISTRIVAQDGWFTSHYYRRSNNKYTALDAKIGSPPKLYKIKIAINETEDRESIMFDLDTYGVNSYTIFNDLEGLCHYLDWKTFSNSKLQSTPH